MTKRRRRTRLLLLPLALAIAVTVAAVASAVIRREDDPPSPPPGITAATASGATVNYDEVGWGQPGNVDVEFQRNAAGEVISITMKDAGGNVLATMTRDQAMAFVADSANTMATPSLMANGTTSTTTSGFSFSQPITSVFGAAVTVNGDVTWH